MGSANMGSCYNTDDADRPTKPHQQSHDEDPKTTPSIDSPRSMQVMQTQSIEESQPQPQPEHKQQQQQQQEEEEEQELEEEQKEEISHHSTTQQSIVHHITRAHSERRLLSKYSVQFTTTEDRTETVFKIKSYPNGRKLSNTATNSIASAKYIDKDTNIEWSLDYYWNDNNDNNNSFFWAIFRFKRYYRLSQGYFKILDYIEDDPNDNKDIPSFFDNKTNIKAPKISSDHLKAFLYFVHHPKIRKYLGIKDRQKWDQHDVTIYIDQQKYTLQFFNGKNINLCQALSILKHPPEIDDDDEKKEDDIPMLMMDESKKNKMKKIFAVYFPKPNQAIQWRWYDNTNGLFRAYNDDELQTLEFEASYYANIQANFPISNPLFQSKYNTSIFDHCYLRRFSKLRSLQSQQHQRFCMRYTLCPIGDSEDYNVVMDQLRLKTQYARTVIRYFDRQKYLMNMMGHTVNETLKRRVVSLDPMITSITAGHGRHIGGAVTMKYPQNVAWIAAFDATPTTDNKYELIITSKFDHEKASPYSVKSIPTPMGMDITTVNIKEAELMTNRCGTYSMWARFRTKRNKHCALSNGYWDISFNDNDKYKQLRQHLDAILSTLQHRDILQHFKIDTGDGGFLCNHNKEQHKEDKEDNINRNNKQNDKVLHITIDEEYEYELLLYNTRPLTETQAIYIKQKIKKTDNASKPYKMLKMYIMYFPKPDEYFNHWQWYDNDTAKYNDYVEHNELLQLECSYLSNLYENYPKHVIHQDTQWTVGYFSHCIFQTFLKNKNIGRNKLYVLRYSVIEELHDKVVVEQVAYTNDSSFSRTLRRITPYELEKEKIDQYVPRMDIEYNDNDQNNTARKPPITHGYTQLNKEDNGHHNARFVVPDNKENTFEDIADRFTNILIKYQKWLCLSNFVKPPGMLPILAKIYNMEDTPKRAIIKLRDDFSLFTQRIKKMVDPHSEMKKISDNINMKIQNEFGHKSKKCLCVERTHRDRRIDSSKEKYFGFEDKKEIITQQLLDSYHCVFLHLYDIKTKQTKYTITVSTEYDEEDDDDDELDEKQLDNDEVPSVFIAKQLSLSMIPSEDGDNNDRISSLITYDAVHKNKNKFNTESTYDTGYRFYYWDYYRFSNETNLMYQDSMADPGNLKADGKYYSFQDWFIVPAAQTLKEEMLAFGDNFGCSIGINQFEEEYEKASIHLNSEEGKALKCTEPNWEDKYGIEMNSLITIQHLLAIQLYCSFTEAVENFAATFRKKHPSETDHELKMRHKKCAWWARYLRECVEGFGLRLRRGIRGIPSTYYRGITKKFLFKKTILQFNVPLSTTVSEGVAENFASGTGCKYDENKINDGLVLTLKPHWGDWRGNIRAWNCGTYSDYPWEQEYLFIGGLEPLVIHNIREVKLNGEIYFHRIQAINNIYQIFKGMACKFNMRPILIKKLIDNRLIDKNNNKQRDNKYISQIFDFYCNGIREITIRLSLMDQSYRKITKNFMDSYNTLRLNKIIKLFPKCNKITLCDGFNYQLVPKDMEYKYNTLGVIEKCLIFVNQTKHSLNKILLEANQEININIINDYNTNNLNKIGWQCGAKNIPKNKIKNNDSSDETEYKYKICRLTTEI